MAKETIVGLDIGTQNVKVAELTKQGDRYSLMRLGMEEFAFRADNKSKVATIKDLFKKSKISIKRVNISVEGPSVIIRNIELPKMTEIELKKAIVFEAEKYIPYNIKEVILDCQILKESNNNMIVLLVAVKKDFINEKIALVHEAGLQPWIVDVDSFALINTFNLSYMQKDKTVVLINIGDNTTNVNILKDGVLNFTRNIALGGNKITKLISEKFNIEEKDAEILKRKPADKKDIILEIASPVFKELSNEIRSSFDYYESQYEEGVGEIYLSGGVTKIQEFSDFLSKNLEVKVQPWNPLKKIKVSPRISQEEIKDLFYFLPVVIGLALRKM